MVDTGNTLSTAGSLSVNSSRNDSIEVPSDTDWFGISLTRGATYEFDVEGSATLQGTLADPYLRLRNSNGSFAAHDDDAGVGLNSQIFYYATVSGQYYLSVGSATTTGTGTYRLSATSLSPSWARLVNVPDNINFDPSHGALDDPGNAFMESILGTPGPGLTSSSGPESLASSQVRSLLVTRDVDPSSHVISVEGIRPAVDSLQQILINANRDYPDLLSHIGTEGMLAVRYISGTTVISNHSWGIAVDLSLDGYTDFDKDGRLSAGLAALIPYFNAAGWVAGAGWGSAEDDMHFEVSQETLQSWYSQGLLNPSPSVSFPVSAQSGPEGADLTFRISILNPNYASVSDYLIYYNTSDGTATAGSDYTGIPNQVAVHFTASSAQFIDVTVHTLTDNNPNEGSEAFNFNIYDFQHTLLNQAQGTITDISNRAPVANNNSYSTPENTALTIASPGVLGNDTDADFNNLTVGSYIGPAHGTLAIFTNGSFTYTPNSGYFGTDSFTYWAYDGTVNSTSPATVSISVNNSLSGLRVSHDFNGDGTSDILWRNSTTGDVGAWEISGGQASWAGFGNGANPWQVVGTGDFNHDGTSDILWRNSTTGDVGTWEISGGQASWAGFGNGANPWQVVGTGDFNHDGTSDILWRNSTTGDVGAWEISGGQASWAGFGNGANPWQVVGG
jgi:hypothetical protein